MQISCPNCKAPLELPPGLLKTGVARVSCARCLFAFVARLGSPAALEKLDRDPTLPIYLEGVKSSSAKSETAGEIGAATPAFIPADTKTTIVIDPALEQDIAEHRSGWISAPTEESVIDSETAALLGLRTRPMDPDDDSLAASATETEVAMMPPLPPDASSEDTARADLASFECYAPIDSPVRTGHPLAAGHAPLGAGGTAPSGGRPAFAPGKPLAAAERPFPAAIPAPAAARLPPIGDHDPTLAQDFRRFQPAHPLQSKPVRVLSMLVTLVVFSCIGFALFVLYQNDWSFDLSNFDKMLSRALGEPAEALPPEIDKLEVSLPIADLTRLAGGEPVVTAEGVIKNVGTKTRRFIYVRAQIKRGSRVVASAEAPAGNLFKRAELAQLTRKQLHASLNPAGQQGRNARIEPGESVAYMVVIWDLPPDFLLSEHEIVADVSQAEIYEGL